jgi:hypothetical protein
MLFTPVLDFMESRADAAPERMNRCSAERPTLKYLTLSNKDKAQGYCPPAAKMHGDDQSVGKGCRELVA